MLYEVITNKFVLFRKAFATTFALMRLYFFQELFNIRYNLND